MRKEGREGAVKELLDRRLPGLIKAWSSCSGQSPDVCRDRLKALFERIQESVEVAWVQRRMIVDEVTSLLHRPRPGAFDSVPGLRHASSAAVGLRRRVPIADIPGMLDALAEVESQRRGESEALLNAAPSVPQDLLDEDLPHPAPMPAARVRSAHEAPALCAA